MKNKVLMTLMMLTAVGLWTALGNSRVYAQDPDLEANIPFKFMVGDTRLPAGKYMIKRVNDFDANALEIRSADDHVAVMFLTESAQTNQTPNKSELVFNRIGDKYFLHQIWSEGDNIGEQLPVSRMEKKMEMGGAKADSHRVTAKHKITHHMKHQAEKK
jgi:hypothetical protein